jgi:hypothetical protein
MAFPHDHWISTMHMIAVAVAVLAYWSQAEAGSDI